MPKQLIIAGFHRSGTSMLAQELHNAGLFVGERLMSPGISNADGHYEDMDFFTFHEKILHFHHTNWQYASDALLTIPTKYEADMDRIIQLRNLKHTQWGFKDPRSTLFLDQWSRHLDNPYTVVIYRHFEECVNSLMHRAAGDIIYNQSSNISFWKDPTLAYRMWLSYNKKIIAHVKKYPETTIVVSHHAVLNGFPIVNTIKEKFGFDLDTSIESSIKKELVGSVKCQHFAIDEVLSYELEETWKILQSLSLAPSDSLDNSKISKKPDAKNTFQQVLVSLDIPSLEDNTIVTTIQKLQEDTLSLEEKIKLIQINRPIFRTLLKNNMLIVALKRLIRQHLESVELYFILIDIYNAEKSYDESEYLLLKLFTIVDVVRPFHFNMLAKLLLEKGESEESTFYIKKAIKLNPNNPDFYITMANIEYKACLYEEALKEIDKALTISVDKPNAIINFTLKKIDILSELGRVEEVENLFTSLAKDFPSNERVLKKVKSFEIVQGLDKRDRDSYYKNILSGLKKDPYFYSRVLALMENLDSEWAKNDLMVRVVGHLKKLVTIQ